MAIGGTFPNARATDAERGSRCRRGSDRVTPGTRSRLCSTRWQWRVGWFDVAGVLLCGCRPTGAWGASLRCREGGGRAVGQPLGARASSGGFRLPRRGRCLAERIERPLALGLNAAVRLSSSSRRSAPCVAGAGSGVSGWLVKRRPGADVVSYAAPWPCRVGLWGSRFGRSTGRAAQYAAVMRRPMASGCSSSSNTAAS